MHLPEFLFIAASQFSLGMYVLLICFTVFYLYYQLSVML